MQACGENAIPAVSGTATAKLLACRHVSVLNACSNLSKSLAASGYKGFCHGAGQGCPFLALFYADLSHSSDFCRKGS